MKKMLMFLILLKVFEQTLFAANYDTLPQGVRLLAVRRVETSPVAEYWSRHSQRESFGTDISLDANLLSNIDQLNQYLLAPLKQIDPNIYDNFSAGSWKLTASSDVRVWGFGGGWGLTDRLTIFGITTYYKANVRMKAKKVKDNNYSDAQKAIDSDSSKNGIIVDPSSLIHVTGGMIQYAVQEHYGYEPLGDWEAEGFGDVELGLKYLISKRKNAGLSGSFGIIIPTGREDDPDIIQDFAFGNGFWSTFLEFETAYHFSKKLDLELAGRISYQFPTRIRERIPTDSGSSISAEEGEFEYHPGSRLDISLGLPVKPLSWLTLNPRYLFEYDESDYYYSEYEMANYWLAQDSHKVAHKYRFELIADSVNAYFTKKFPLPASAKIMYEKIFQGTNVPSVSRAEFELRLFF